MSKKIHLFWTIAISSSWARIWIQACCSSRHWLELTQWQIQLEANTPAMETKGIHLEWELTQKYFQKHAKLRKSPSAACFPGQVHAEAQQCISERPSTQKGSSSQIPPSTTLLIIVIITWAPLAILGGSQKTMAQSLPWNGNLPWRHDTTG